MRLLWLALGLLVLAPSTLHAQSYGQYLVVLDDSGSMDQTDPKRLVVLAAHALAAALEDGDQVMLVGLNELASGAPAAFRSPRELLEARDGAEGPRTLATPLAERLGRHEGQTPCRAALDHARTLLESVASAGAPQTLLMLTDGACNGGATEPAERWLGGLRAHREGRFRFVLLMRAGPERPDRQLVEYARRTGWQSDVRVSFDARALVRAFAEVLSFSRGLRFDDGGRVGLERTFAGARHVRVLSLAEGGAERLGLERLAPGGAATAIAGGPTFRSVHGWAFRGTTTAPSATPFALRSNTAGAEVLVIPVYGRLHVEAVIAPCGDAPPLPWTRERAVRAGQPACAFARLVGDEDAIHPGRSFDFELSLCNEPSCADASPMQPAEDGTFHAILGDLSLGRHERTFRAHGGALAFPVEVRRGTASVAFGVQRVARAEHPDESLTSLDVGTLPSADAPHVTLQYHGAYPGGARAEVRCVVEGAARECLRCTPAESSVALQDPAQVQLSVTASPFCPAASEHGELPIDARLELVAQGEAESSVGTHVLPIRGLLRYAASNALEVTLEGGAHDETSAEVPAPSTLEDVQARVELEGGDLVIEARAGRLRAGEGGVAPITLVTDAEECCAVGDYEGFVILGAGESELRVPLRVHVTDPGFWVCPGRKILRWTLAILGLLFVFWILRGLFGPTQFRKGALLLWAESHDQLLKLREGDDGWRPLERFVETKRGFRRNAALYLGGPRAPLPSLKRLPLDGRIEATKGGGATLIVTGSAVERFSEANGWQELAPGTYPISNRVMLRRGDELYLELRR
ncbi:MAG: VWA domain-containing protein [Sandaracinus sp.]|nr:VWA domain-containing protein [Sandaracinus sp.]